eukprot:CAMPEP_0174734328 /NCGR_PEP_ID=MMETSP1094-20130205/63107_1 /TAXON_ID=156173 /ORGANISM="Chrysochromulina brevifilum, Strain UTEX LB 985" /LENGTH=46 /DNA_ID= /DNA_START= /DNA_END= /DNA_ORIENTATION=
MMRVCTGIIPSSLPSLRLTPRLASRLAADAGSDSTNVFVTRLVPSA